MTSLPLAHESAALFPVRSVAAGERLRLVHDPATLEREWRALERCAVISPYQCYDFVKAWSTHAAREAAIEPCIGVIDGDDGIEMILPFGVSRRGLRLARYLCGSHSNLNMPLVAPRLASTGRRRFGPILDEYCRRAEIDMLALHYQPRAWLRTAHPFAELASHRSPDDVMRLEIDGDPRTVPERVLSKDGRSKLRRKERRLREAGARLDERPKTPANVERLIGVFLRQKRQRLQAMGADDPFASPGVKAFLAEAAFAALAGEGGLELQSAQVGDRVLAVRGVLRHGEQMSLMFQSFDFEDPLSRNSPGDVLFGDMLARDVARGVRHVDFGVGDARYKESWANGRVEMFDLIRGVTLAGKLCAAAAASRAIMLRRVKSDQRLYGALRRLRARLARAAR